MKKNELIKLYLDNKFSINQATCEIDFVCSINFGLSQKDLILNDNLPNELEQVVLERVKTKRPIQQIIGKSYFLGETFFVDSSTLIPRPETELLVLKVIDKIKETKAKNILDIGTGTGCIPISVVKKCENISACALDISSRALDIAKKNAKLFSVNNRINFILSDLFENINEKFDIIVSNPPYICPTMYETLEDEVKNFEPQNALLAQDEMGIEFYEKIIKNAPKYLNNNGYLMFEICFNQGTAIKNIFEEYGYSDIVIEKDLDNKDRIAYAKKY